MNELPIRPLELFPKILTGHRIGNSCFGYGFILGEELKE
jgi:hypothetical protein